MTTTNDLIINYLNDAEYWKEVFSSLNNDSFKNMCNDNPPEMHANFVTSEYTPGIQVKFPGIKHVQFNLKTTDFKRDFNAEPKVMVVNGQKKKIYPYVKDENGKKIQIDIDPVLATIVYFNDGTKTVVQNSKLDKITLEDVTLSDGTVVKTASAQSKELAVIYAIVKRLFGSIDKLGNVVDTGLARRLGDIVAAGYDTDVEAAKNRITENARKTAAAKQAQKPAKKRYSINDTLARINALMDRAEAGDSKAAQLLKDINA